jgi:C4-dicarboxylate-specific signal transduction histidine kinase
MLETYIITYIIIENLFQYALNIYNVIHIFYPQTNLEQEEQELENEVITRQTNLEQEEQELENEVITRQTNDKEFTDISREECKISHRNLIGKICV